MSKTLWAEIAEEFLDAQEPLRVALTSKAWRGRSEHLSSRELSDEELLASAWAELPGERRWTPVVWSATDGKWRIAVERSGVGSRLDLAEAEMVAKYKTGWSLPRIAAAVGCSRGTVVAVLDKHRVPRRSLQDALCGDRAFGRKDIRLDESTVTDLRMRRWVHGETWDSLAKRYGVPESTCRKAGLGETWKHVPMPAACISAMQANLAQPKRAKEKPLTEELVWQLRIGALRGRSDSELALEFGRERKTVNNAVSGRTWKHVPFPAAADAAAVRDA